MLRKAYYIIYMVCEDVSADAVDFQTAYHLSRTETLGPVSIGSFVVATSGQITPTEFLRPKLKFSHYFF